MTDIVYIQTLGMGCLTILAVASLRVVRRFLELRSERRVPLEMHGLNQRLERIESIVESTAIEVERISEANRFMAKLLAEREAPAIVALRPERVITPH